MRLYLSSQGFGNHIKRLKELAGDNRHIVLVNNAKDGAPREEIDQHVAEKKLEIESAGFSFELLDLRDYFSGKKDQLEKILSSAGVLWVSGGNTFVLRKAFKYSGLDELLIKMLKRDQLIYGGSSAGAIIATPSLHGVEYGDMPNFVPLGYKAETIWEGLALIDLHLVVHYESDWFAGEAEAMRAALKAKNYDHVTLSDGEVYVVDGDRKELLQ